MPSNYYSDDDGGSPAAAAPPEMDEDKGHDETALLPKSLFPGKELKPGDKCDITIVRVTEDSYEIEGCPSEDDEKKPEDDTEQPSEMPENRGSEGGGDEGMYS